MARTKGYTDRVNILKKVLIDGNWKFVPALKRNGNFEEEIDAHLAKSKWHYALAPAQLP